jgi:hypothetical protein
MITGFKHKGLRRLFEADETKGVRADRVARLRRILLALNNSSDRREWTSRLAAACAEGRPQRDVVRRGFRELARHVPLGRRSC